MLFRGSLKLKTLWILYLREKKATKTRSSHFVALAPDELASSSMDSSTVSQFEMIYFNLPSLLIRSHAVLDGIESLIGSCSISESGTPINSA
jgi:hypothetical protein